MRTLIAMLLIFVLTGGAVVTGLSQTPAPRALQDQQREVVSTAEVPLDVVVRDKRGRLLNNLTAADFEVYEDGVRQEVNSFRLVVREPSASHAAASGETAKPSRTPNGTTRSATVSNDTDARISAIALVFDRLSPESRPRAREAALKYVGESLKPGDYVGVFLTDLSLNVLQPYTNDAQLVKKAVERAGTVSSALYTSNNVQARQLRKKIIGFANNQSPGDQAELELSLMSLRSLERWEEMQRDQQGYATSTGLLAIADSLRQLPGRKTVLFFSEGMILPPAMMAHFRAVINTANRSNVSFYTVDAAGLRTESKTSETRKEIESRSEFRIEAPTSVQELQGPMTRGLERNEDLLRLNPESGLGQLANQTGGFLISDTNNLTEGLRRIDEDMRSYYLLSYVPKNQNYDGRFRTIEVKMKESGLNIQSRKGYFAINASYASPVLAYEAPALAILGSNRRPNDLAVRVAAMSFPEPNRLGLVPVVAEVPMRFVTFKGDNQKKQYTTDFSVVVLVKDAHQQVVKKLSNQYQLNGTLDKLEAARQGEILFYRETELPPGRYTVETIVYDALGDKAGVRAGGVEVPNSSEAKLHVSSLVLIKRAGQLTAADKQGSPSPFHFGEMLVYPNLGQPFSKASAKQLPFFLTVYPDKSVAARPLLTIEIMQAGRAAGQTKSELPATDVLGRIQYAGALPLDKFQPGAYELKITVNDGQSTAARTVEFTVEP